MSKDDTCNRLRAALGDAAHALAVAIDAPAYMIRYDNVEPPMIVSVMPGEEIEDPTDEALITVVCVQFGLAPADALKRLFRFAADAQAAPIFDMTTKH